MELLKYLLPLTPVGVLIGLLLFNPEKIEKWSALFWKMLSGLGGLFRAAHKKYVKHDLQGRLNDFAKYFRKNVPGAQIPRFRIEWVDPNTQRKSFLEKDQVVLRLRRDDPADRNFVHGAFLYISGTLLRKAKRYLANPQQEAIDLFVCTKLLEREKPSVVGVFLEEYLHPQTDDAKSKVALYVDDLAILESGGLFFPVFLQELEYLGDKVFGRRRDERVGREVHGMIAFLKKIASRTVGDDTGELNFPGEYCRFGIVIVGKPSKLLTSIEPYVRYIRNALVAHQVETIYILARAENAARVREICAQFEDGYECSREVHFRKLLKYPNRKELALQYLAVMRRRGVELVQASGS